MHFFHEVKKFRRKGCLPQQSICDLFMSLLDFNTFLHTKYLYKKISAAYMYIAIKI